MMDRENYAFNNKQHNASEQVKERGLFGGRVGVGEKNLIDHQDSVYWLKVLLDIHDGQRELCL